MSQLDVFLSRTSSLLERFSVPVCLATACLFPALWFFLYGPGPDGLHDRSGEVLGHDFSHFWIAGRAALSGHATDPFDLTRHVANVKAWFGPDAGEFGWHYPPMFLLPAAGLALLPLPQAFLLFTVVTGALLLLAVWKIWPDWRALVVVAGSPAFFANVNYGQNGALSAALVAFALLPVLRGREPGALPLSLLAYKPNLGLVFPVALAGGGFWRAMAMTAVLIGVQVAVTVAAFGPEVWTAFFRGLGDSSAVLFDQVAAGTHRYASVFGAARNLGAGVPLAHAMQVAMAASVLAACWSLWRGEADRRLKVGVAIAAIPLLSPYVMTYDMLILVPAVLLLLDHGRSAGRGRFDVPLAFAVWSLPAAGEAVALATHVSLNLLLCLAVFGVLLQRAWRDVPAPVLDVARAPQSMT